METYSDGQPQILIGLPGPYMSETELTQCCVAALPRLMSVATL
jgi:hypothetical protein